MCEQQQNTNEPYHYNVVDEKYFTNSLRPEIKIYFDSFNCYLSQDIGLIISDNFNIDD